MADSYVALPLQLVGTMILSRLLTPVETGVFAVAAVFASFASTFRDFGVAEYLIQEKELTDDKIRAALTVNIVISWAMGLALFFCAPLAAEFYRSQGIAEVMRVQAFNFILIPFGAVTMANFRRQLDFRPIFVASLLANLMTFVVASLCAFNGLGYMSLAWSSLAGVMITVATSLWFRPANFPRWPGIKGVGKVLHFGKFASGIYIIGQLGKGAPEMIIGRAQSLAEVAMFSRASGLVELFNRTVLRAVMPVCMPYFAQSNREQGSMVRGYLMSISYVTAIGWPFLVFIGVVAFSAIRILYGTQWTSAVPLAQLLCVVGAIELIHTLSKEVLMAGGDVKRSNALQLGIQLSRIAGLLAVVPFGLVGACWGLLAASVFNVAYTQWHLARALGLGVLDVVRSCRLSLYVTVAAVLPVAIAAGTVGVTEINYWWFAFAGGGATAAIWVLALRYFSHPLWTEIAALFETASRKISSLTFRADQAASKPTPAGAAVEQARSALSRRFDGADVTLSGPVSVRSNSEVFRVSIGGRQPALAALKVCLLSGTKTPDEAAAKSQFQALERVSAVLSNGEDIFRVPVPLYLSTENGIFAMSWADGESLTQKMQRLGIFESGWIWFENVGAWLGNFHRLGPLKEKTADFADRLEVLDQICANPLPDKPFARAALLLRDELPSLMGISSQTSWLHGDCKTDNFILGTDKTYGIDIGLAHENPVEYDLAQFLNNLGLLLSSPRYYHLRSMASELESSFLRGYERTGPAISLPYLKWLRLNFLLSFWHSQWLGRKPSVRHWMLNREFSKLARRLMAKP